MVPHGLGQKVRFEKNIGPILEKIDIDKVLNKSPKDFEKELFPIYLISMRDIFVDNIDQTNRINS